MTRCPTFVTQSTSTERIYRASMALADPMSEADSCGDTSACKILTTAYERSTETTRVPSKSPKSLFQLYSDYKHAYYSEHRKLADLAAEYRKLGFEKEQLESDLRDCQDANRQAKQRCEVRTLRIQ